MNIVLTYQDLPGRIRALVHMNDDGSYTIIINARCNWETQKAAVLHELMHIKGNDFSTDVQADMLEKLMHGQACADADLDDFRFFIAG